MSVDGDHSNARMKTSSSAPPVRGRGISRHVTSRHVKSRHTGRQSGAETDTCAKQTKRPRIVFQHLKTSMPSRQPNNNYTQPDSTGHQHNSIDSSSANIHYAKMRPFRSVLAAFRTSRKRERKLQPLLHNRFRS